jgi:uncharacterized damage-inducible protein DinB
MELIDHLRRQFHYDSWANQEVLSGVRARGTASARPLQLMAHILSASRLWVERLRQQPESLPVWPEFTLKQCEEQAPAVACLWKDYLGAITGPQLDQSITYKNTKGEPWSSTVQDVLTHVVVHGAYHRGQIASWMRENGQTPAYTDFIHAVRQGLIE